MQPGGRMSEAARKRLLIALIAAGILLFILAFSVSSQVVFRPDVIP